MGDRQITTPEVDPNIQIVDNASQFMSDLLAIPAQFDSDGNVTVVATKAKAREDIDFATTFSGLEGLGDLWKRHVTDAEDGPVRTTALRSLVSDSGFHQAINNPRRTALDPYTMDADYLNKKKDKLNIIAFAAAAAKNEEGNDIDTILAMLLSDQEKGKKIFCMIYDELRQHQDTYLTTLTDVLAGGAPTRTGSQEDIKIKIETYAREQLQILSKKNEEELRVAITEYNQTHTPLTTENSIVEKIVNKLINPNQKKLTLAELKTIVREFTYSIAKFKKNVLEQVTRRPKATVAAASGIFSSSRRDSGSSSTSGSSRATPVSEPPAKDLGFVGNYDIVSYILDAYGINLLAEELPSCNNPVDEDSDLTGEPSNSKLSGDTPQNCYTNGSLLRISPWVRHDKTGKYFLVCQACGLPMFSSTYKDKPTLDDPIFAEFVNPFESNPMEPISKTQLGNIAGKTQCDHTVPLAMMFFGLNKKLEDTKFQNIGMGSNFCPLHPGCNTKKSNMSPKDYWAMNSGNIMEKVWNGNWTDLQGKVPTGPWENSIAGINEWCETNDWSPKYYARLVQWKYFSALEKLVKPDSEVSRELTESIMRAVDLYRSVDTVKNYLKGIVSGLTASGITVNLKNIITSIDVAEAAAALQSITLIESLKRHLRDEQSGRESALLLAAAHSEQQAVAEAQSRAIAIHQQQLIEAAELQGKGDWIRAIFSSLKGGEKPTRKNLKRRTNETLKHYSNKKQRKTKIKNKKKRKKRTIKK